MQSAVENSASDLTQTSMFDLSNTEAVIDPGRLCRSVFSYQDVSDWAELISDECHRFNDAEKSSIDVLSPRRSVGVSECRIDASWALELGQYLPANLLVMIPGGRPATDVLKEGDRTQTPFLTGGVVCRVRVLFTHLCKGVPSP